MPRDPSASTFDPPARATRLLRAAFSSLALVLFALVVGCMEVPYDVVIRGGAVLDGSGSEAVTADVGIRGDRIAQVGDLSGAEALREIDATGLYVAPGFIDLHSHASGGLVSEERSMAHALLAQGITTAVINPDGGGPVDLEAQRADLLEHGLGVNAIQLVPHASIRQEAMGGSFDRAPSDEEMAEMIEMVRAGMEAGAFGLSTGLFYTPGFFAETEEIVELARVVAGYDGVHSSHIRDESDYSVGVVAAVQEIIDISRESGVVGIVSHIKALGPNVWGHSEEIVERIQSARDDGVEVWADQYPYEASATGFTAALVPAWARDGGSDDMQARFEDPETAPRIRDEMAENLARRGGADRIMFRGTDALAGRTLAELAEEAGRDPVDQAFEMIRQGTSPGIISFNMHEDDIERLMRQPWTLTSTDGSLPVFGEGTPHPRGYGAFPRKLETYVVEREVVDLPTAIHSMTGASAEAFRITERGRLAPGSYADIVVFDLGQVHAPADFMEPHQYSQGMRFVLVNGVFAVDDGEFTDALPGWVLNRRGPDFTRAKTVTAQP
jgi:N-acyl-D-amino-acid deacylase